MIFVALNEAKKISSRLRDAIFFLPVLRREFVIESLVAPKLNSSLNYDPNMNTVNPTFKWPKTLHKVWSPKKNAKFLCTKSRVRIAQFSLPLAQTRIFKHTLTLTHAARGSEIKGLSPEHFRRGLSVLLGFPVLFPFILSI